MPFDRDRECPETGAAPRRFVTVPIVFDRLLAPVDRLIAALGDPTRGERNAVLVLIAYAALWTLYGTVAKSSQDIHFDMGETVAWARELDLGYAKHPPLAAWLAFAWFSVFPLTDWSFYLLSMSQAALGLWFAWRLAAHYLEADKRIVGLSLLTLVPLLNFHALKFNVNTVMIPTWAAATYFFLRSFETRGFAHAMSAGVAAALAMLAKYWSVLLLVGLAVAALSDPRRRDYFRSPAPWVTAVTGLLVFSPHLWWLAHAALEPLAYATTSHAAATRWRAALTGARYVAGVLAYAAAPIVLTVALSRPSLAAVADTLWPADTRRRHVLIAFVTPILLPTALTAAMKSEAVSIWAMGSMTLAPVVLLSSPLLSFPREAVRYAVGLAVAFPMLMVLLSPLVAALIHERGVANRADHYRLLAAEIERAWHAATDRPLRFVAGDPALAFGTVFYLKDRPSAFTELDRRARALIDPARVERDGVAIVCVADDAECVAMIRSREATSAHTQRREVEIVRTHWGRPGPPRRYLICIVPPR